MAAAQKPVTDLEELFEPPNDDPRARALGGSISTEEEQTGCTRLKTVV
jgi:hypothetical protein